MTTLLFCRFLPSGSVHRPIVHWKQRIVDAMPSGRLIALVAAACVARYGAASSEEPSLDAGLHSRIRQTCVRNAPGLPNGGADRIEVFGSACFELFNPGGYYASSKPAIYVRWLLNFRF